MAEVRYSLGDAGLDDGALPNYTLHPIGDGMDMARVWTMSKLYEEILLAVTVMPRTRDDLVEEFATKMSGCSDGSATQALYSRVIIFFDEALDNLVECGVVCRQ